MPGTSPPEAPPARPAAAETEERPLELAEEIRGETGIDLTLLRSWWAGDAAMPSRAFCRLGLARLIDLVLANRREEALSSPDLWLMQDGAAASDLAPAAIDLDRFLEWLRAASLREGLVPRDNRVFKWYAKFGVALSRWGRLEGSDVGLSPAQSNEDANTGLLGRLFRRRQATGGRVPLREIQDIPGFFTYLEAVQDALSKKAPDPPDPDGKKA
ncbi:hypothetical protein IIA16_03565 [bacterium]|nr:hypothetical protein [bacterium]